mmetsp:Transcript_4606/g.6394  ORF Transcript_4606/g.6394 Transcript_4606/m.6394 type:complete len:103 (-) Transcript_4606:947-1255(-)
MPNCATETSTQATWLTLHTKFAWIVLVKIFFSESASSTETRETGESISFVLCSTVDYAEPCPSGQQKPLLFELYLSVDERERAKNVRNVSKHVMVMVVAGAK